MVTGKRLLGSTGFEVSEISFGTWQLGGKRYGPVHEEEAHTALAAYLDAGGNFIDTARLYGDSEKVIGNYFDKHGGRKDVYISTKTVATEKDEILADFEKSLSFLKTDYIDLYYLHRPPEDPESMTEVLEVFEKLKRDGKIRSIGASVKGPDVTQETVDLCRAYIRSGGIDALMIIYSIFRQQNEAIFDEARKSGVGIVTRTVLESGFLTGKYKPGDRFEAEGDHRGRWGPKRLEWILRETQELAEMVPFDEYGSLVRFAVRFAIDPPAVSSVVVGARNPGQINQTASVSELPPVPSGVRETLASRYRDQGERFNTGEDE